jgi:hypothetical protein
MLAQMKSLIMSNKSVVRMDFIAQHSENPDIKQIEKPYFIESDSVLKQDTFNF